MLVCSIGTNWITFVEYCIFDRFVAFENNNNNYNNIQISQKARILRLNAYSFSCCECSEIEREHPAGNPWLRQIKCKCQTHTNTFWLVIDYFTPFDKRKHMLHILTRPNFSKHIIFIFLKQQSFLLTMPKRSIMTMNIFVLIQYSASHQMKS